MREIRRPYPTMIRDDFFPDPDAVRQWALRMDFLDCRAFNQRYGVNESWPGRRTQSLHDVHPGFVQELANQIIVNVVALGRCDYRMNCSFQLCYQSDGDSWVHRDETVFEMAGLIYLTPDPPAESGTLFYEEKDGGYRVVDRVGNRYNRLLLFDTQVPHKSDVYFGGDKENGRLTLPFFIGIRRGEG